MSEFSLEDLERIFDKKIKPLCSEIQGFKKTLFGEDGRGGIAKDVNRSLELSEQHEDILRGRDRTSGMIKKMNYLWGVALTGATGLFWKAWDWFSHNPPPPPPHH